MAQDYYFNSTKINDWDGAKGVIVSTIAHDASPEVSLTEADVARGPGKVLRQSLPRSKRISITGAVIGTTQADFEARMDTLKALFAQPGQLRITNYGTTDVHVTTFDWSAGFAGTNVSVETGTVRKGRSSTKLACVGATTVTATASQAHDLSAFASSDTITLSFYVANYSNLSSVVLKFTTAAGTDYYTATFSAPFSSGWNDVTILRSALVATGSPSWSTITSLSVAATTTNDANVFLDDLKITTTADSRTYDVALDGPISFTREPFNIDWVGFSLSLTASDGRARSGIQVVASSPTSTKSQLTFPRYLVGSGQQGMNVRVDTGTATPAKVVVSDHFTDIFGSYAATADLANTYTTAGTWTLASYQAYPTVLAEVTGAAGYQTAAIANASVSDGEIIALFAPGTGPFGIFARASSPATPMTGSFVRAQASGTPNIADSSILSVNANQVLASTWWWARLVCKGNLVELYIKNVDTSFSSPPSDNWVKVASGTSNVRGAGAWGIWTNTATVRCAYLELIDYATEQRNAVTFKTASNAQAGVAVDTTVLAADALASDAPVTGAIPTLGSGYQYLTALMPSSQLGSAKFYQPSSFLSGYDAFGGAATVRLGLTFSSGSNTYIRRRGTFLYVGMDAASTGAKGAVIVELQTTAAGVPTGTIVNDVNSNPATVTIAEADIAARVQSAGATYNASLVPIEIVWAADIAVSASTTYALVVRIGGVQVDSWFLPYSTVSTGLSPIVTAPSNAGAWSTTSHYGFALLEGNVVFGNTGTPARIKTTYLPSFL